MRSRICNPSRPKQWLRSGPRQAAHRDRDRPRSCATRLIVRSIDCASPSGITPDSARSPAHDERQIFRRPCHARGASLDRDTARLRDDSCPLETTKETTAVRGGNAARTSTRPTSRRAMAVLASALASASATSARSRCCRTLSRSAWYACGSRSPRPRTASPARRADAMARARQRGPIADPRRTSQIGDALPFRRGSSRAPE